jgi:hypothetical protein
MANGKLTLRGAIDKIDEFCPIKIIFNGIVLYNDYDSGIEIEKGVYGEVGTPIDVIPNRMWQFDKYIVNSINIEIVEFHHSIIAIQGEYQEEE